MSLLYRLYLLFFVLFTLSCTDNSQTTTPTQPLPKQYSPDFWGTASATRNGQPMQNLRISAATRTPCNRHAFDLFITEYNSDGAELLTFTLANLPQRVGTLNSFRADYKNLFCGTDTLGSTLTARAKLGYEGTYKPTGRTNQLIISTFDSVKREIMGSFRLKLVIDERGVGPMPDTIRIESGQFYTKLKGPNGKYE